MTENVFGPYGPGINESITRPSTAGPETSVDTWFTPCVNGDPNTGTKISYRWLNFVTANMRRAVRGMGVAENPLDDDLILKAIQKAILGVENIGTGAGLIFKAFNSGTQNYSLRKIKAGTGIGVSVVDDDIVIANTGLGDGGAGFRVLIFSHTGADQPYVVPAGVGHIQVKAWGAKSKSAWNGYVQPGAFAGGVIPVSAGQNFSVVVGEHGDSWSFGGTPESGGASPPTYGFGGAGSDDAGSDGDGGNSGGGLTGLFTGTGAVLATDTSRALVIAGGGGGAVTMTTNNHQPGRNGGAPSAGGQGNMQGGNGTSSAESGGGGGGYAGGSISGYTGNGGTSFAHGSVASASLLYTPDGSTTVPNTADPYYSATDHGRLVIIEMA